MFGVVSAADEWVSGVCVYYKAVWVCVRGSCVLSSVGVFSLSRKTRNLDELHARILIFFSHVRVRSSRVIFWHPILGPGLVYGKWSYLT